MRRIHSIGIHSIGWYDRGTVRHGYQNITVRVVHGKEDFVWEVIYLLSEQHDMYRTRLECRLFSRPKNPHHTNTRTPV